MHIYSTNHSHASTFHEQVSCVYVYNCIRMHGLDDEIFQSLEEYEIQYTFVRAVPFKALSAHHTGGMQYIF